MPSASVTPQRSPSRRGIVEAAGHLLEYHWYHGAADRPVIVFLHEGLGCIDLWRDLPAAVAERTGAPVLVYSRYGYGQSEVLVEPFEPDFMHLEARDALPDLLDHFHVHETVLIGHSDGASIALIAAGEAIVEPAGMILLAPHVMVEDISIASIAAARKTFETTDLKDRLAKYHRDPERTFMGWNDIWLDPRFRDWDIRGTLAGIECPVMLIQGADDEYGTLAQLEAIELRVRGSCEHHVLDACGHSPHRDQPAATLDLIERFVDGL